MFYYAQIDENNICIGVSQLSGEVNVPNMISVDSLDGRLMGKRYHNGGWEDIPQAEPAEPEPTDQEIIQAEMLLNQHQIICKQTEIDMTLAELLLNQQGVER